jgi:hypothetical protein
MANKKARFGTVILCDIAYIDKESNKPIIAGIYAGDMLVSDFPAAIRTALYIEYFPVALRPHTIKVTFATNRKPFAAGLLNVDGADPPPHMLMLPALDIPLTGPCTLTIRASVDNGPDVLLLRKKVGKR